MVCVDILLLFSILVSLLSFLIKVFVWFLKVLWLLSKFCLEDLWNLFVVIVVSVSMLVLMLFIWVCIGILFLMIFLVEDWIVERFE